MGTSHSQIQNEDLFKEFKKRQWTRIKEQGRYELWQNSTTSQICEAYKLDFIPQEGELEHYRFRHYNQNADNFVEIRYIDIEKNRSLCNHGESYILTEFIPVKLSEMHDLTNNEGYSILRASYRAFHTMQAFHGPFIPNQELIGINLIGKPKIWLNKDHSKNKADSIIKAQIWQKHMGEVSQNVKRILEMVEEKVKGNRFPTDFRNYFYDNMINFSQASEFVEDYCEKYRINIPNRIEYAQFVEDKELAKIIHEFNVKRQMNPLNDKLNSMESTYEHQRLLKSESSKFFKRSDSHQILGHHENIHLARNQSAFNMIPLQQKINTPQVHRTIFSPVIHRTNMGQINIPARGQIVARFQKQSRVLSPQIVIPYEANIRSAISVIPNQPSRLIPESPKTINYRNLKTPAHVIGNYTIIPPNRITEFQLPVRKQSDNLQSEKSADIQQSEGKKSESIHEKIKEFENDDMEYLNDSVPQNELVLPNSNVEQLREPSSQNQQFQNYINNNSQISQQRSEDQQNITSEPDWQQIEDHNHIHQNHYEQYKYEPQQYYVPLDEEKNLSPTNEFHQQQKTIQSKHGDISPIKINSVKNIEQFENHYAMFAKYAQSNKNGQPNSYLQFNQTQHQDEVANSSSFQPRNLDLNQSVTMSDQDPNNVSTLQYEENETSNNQPQQTSALQSFQNIHRNSSKNTSINKNGQSSGTLVVHESQQNIYQGVSNDERNYKIRQQCIQQNSQESQNQEIIDQNLARRQLINNILEEHDEEENEKENPHWQNQHHHFNEVRQLGHSDNQEPQILVFPKGTTQTNQYNNLHFRNQSDELYQYTPVESVYKTESGDHWFPSFSKPSGVQELVQLEKPQDIEEYIRNKYSGLIGGHSLPVNKKEIKSKSRSSKECSNRAMTFAKPFERQSSHEEVEIETKQYDENQQIRCNVQKVDSLYEKIDSFDNNLIQVPKKTFETQQDNNDFLDVGNLEKSLDQKYNKHLTEKNHIRVTSPKNGHNIKGSQTMSEEDGMNVAALEQRLLKFEERQSIERQKSQRKIEAENDEPIQPQSNELNFNELDNIVELMDKKIQESQKKQLNKSTQDIRQSQKISEFGQRENQSDPLQNLDLQTSLNNIRNKQISLKDIPVLAKGGASNTSNSVVASKLEYYSRYGINSEDFATGKSSTSNDYSIGKETYLEKKQSKNYDKRFEALNPVFELDRKYENYSSKNISSYNYDLPALNIGSTSTNEIYRKSSRRSSKNIEEAKRLAEQISGKYDKYMSSQTSSNYQVQKPFAKKSYTNIVDTSYDNQSSRNITNSSNNINEQPKQVPRISARDIHRKRSSYLNPIEELNCQNWASPLKDSPPHENQQNYLKLSNQNSRAPSARNNEADKLRKNSSKVSYDELRDLLWK